MPRADAAGGDAREGGPMGEGTGIQSRVGGQRGAGTVPDGGTPPAVDGEFARWLAARAGQVLMEVRERVGFDDAAALKAAGDQASHDLLRAELARWRPL